MSLAQGNAADDVRITTFILKVASRCNLNCRYCYMYNKGDESFRSQPNCMDSATVSVLLSRIASYCAEEKLEKVTFVFHGGEPLLAGIGFFRYFIRQAAAILGTGITPAYAIQTNGILLTDEWLDLFHEFNFQFGISLDGPAAINDRNRINHSSGGSYSLVKRALDQVLMDKRLKRLFGGVLTVIDLSADPLEIYHHWRDIGIRRCDFLLPDATHDNPAPRLLEDGCTTPYADWLIKIFDVWFRSKDTRFSIRLFETIMNLLFDPTAGYDCLGGGQNGVLVIETDGGIEPVDVLKICGPSFTKLGLNVNTHEIRDAYSSELVRLYQKGMAGVCDMCQSCPIVKVCGGGYLPHRYSLRGGFANPSVYCRDLTKLIVHVRSRVLATIPAKTRRKLGMQPLSHESVIAAQLMVNRRKISSAANSCGVDQLSSSSGQLRVPAPE
jgi:uncharacterized protein